MTSRERVLRTFRFETTDRAPYDFLEGCVWPELMDFFRDRYGLDDELAVQDYFDTDYRWWHPTVGDDPYASRPGASRGTYSTEVWDRPLQHATTVDQVLAHQWPDLNRWDFSGVPEMRQRYPDKALVVITGWYPMFCSACDMFGIENALMNMAAAPEVMDAFFQKQHEFFMHLVEGACEAGKGCADIVWLGDDFAGQQGLLMGGQRWRRFFKERVREQIGMIRDYGFLPLYHSCGAVRDILPDLIELGVAGHLTFQTSASGMDAASIARDFGGRINFYGGIDTQTLLSFGTADEVRAEVRKNIDLFRNCGGYTVSSAHCDIPSVRGENMVAMLEEARDYRP